jgi:transposase
MKKIYEIYEEETGKRWFTNSVNHGEIAYASWDYQNWLEEKASRDSRILSAVPNWNFCPNCGLKWEKDSEAFGCWKCNYVRH